MKRPKFWQKKSVAVSAIQWFKNGDHPNDDVWRAFNDGTKPVEPREGKIVRYFRDPNLSGEKLCLSCGKPMHDHGWIEALEHGNVVCPGDYVITGIAGDVYPCKRRIFLRKYERTNKKPRNHAGQKPN